MLLSDDKTHPTRRRAQLQLFRLVSAFSQALRVALVGGALSLGTAHAATAYLWYYSTGYMYGPTWLTAGTDFSLISRSGVPEVCTGPVSVDYYAGAPGGPYYVTESTPATGFSDPNGQSYYYPVAYSNCRDRGGTYIYPGGIYHSPRSPWGITVCNPGFIPAQWTAGAAWQCTADTASTAQVSVQNEQGPPLNCGPCLEKWLAENAPNSTSPTLLRGDPVNASNGNELLTESDYQGAGGNLLEFNRYYNSGAGFSYGYLGPGWRHSYSYSAVVVGTAASSVTLIRPDGSSLSFKKNPDTSYTGPAYDTGKLVGTFSSSSSVTTLTYTRADGTKENYANNGYLSSIVFGQGGQLTFSSPSATPSYVMDNRGHKLTFGYATVSGGVRIAKLTTNGGAVYAFGYDNYGRLTGVSYPDGSYRSYQYPPETIGNSVNLNANKLTNVIDENGSTFTTITYDAQGRATSTQHGTGVELTTLSYNGLSTTVTNSLGVAETMSFATTLDRPQTSSVVCATGCSAGATSDTFSYDSRGNITSVVNKQGVQTCFAYEGTRNLPVLVVDGLPANAACTDAFANPPAASRVRTYQWHAQYSLPTATSGPQSKTFYSYDNVGRKLSQSDQETSDYTGATGLNAQAIGTSRTRSWTYNAGGSTLSAKAPRSDVNSTTTFAYDSVENLVSITDAAGLITTLGNYDSDGRPLLVTAPNGLQTAVTYDARGRLTQVAAGGAVTTYGYDAAGMLVSTTLPSGVSMTFGYDAAHRLVWTQDSLGNRSDRVLDSEGNVLQETVTGNGGALALSRQATYDQLSRMTSLTKPQ